MIFEGLDCGEYLIKLNIEAKSDTSVTVTTNHRRFLLRDLPMKAGESRSFSFAVALKDADFQKRSPYRDNAIELVHSGDCGLRAEIEAVTLPVIYCLGDSTVCDQEDGGTGMSQCCGWGQTLGMFLGDSCAVSNHAEQGTHTADCLSCHIKPVLSQLRSRDIVLVQFGHNDQKQSWLDAYGGYKENLLKIADAVLEKGGVPVLCTPINRLIYVDGRLNNYLDDWAAAVREAAELRGLKMIDLHACTTEAYLRLGDKAEELFYHSPNGLDRTHPNDNGGVFIGERVAQELKI